MLLDSTSFILLHHSSWNGALGSSTHLKLLLNSFFFFGGGRGHKVIWRISDRFLWRRYCDTSHKTFTLELHLTVTILIPRFVYVETLRNDSFTAFPTSLLTPMSPVCIFQTLLHPSHTLTMLTPALGVLLMLTPYPRVSKHTPGQYPLTVLVPVFIGYPVKSFMAFYKHCEMARIRNSL